MRACPNKIVDLSLSRDIRIGASRALELRLDMFNAFNTVVISNRQNEIQFVSPTDLTIRNSQTLANGSIDPARLTPRTAGFGAATARNGYADHADAGSVPVLEVITQAIGRRASPSRLFLSPASSRILEIYAARTRGTAGRIHRYVFSRRWSRRIPRQSGQARTRPPRPSAAAPSSQTTAVNVIMKISAEAKGLR